MADISGLSDIIRQIAFAKEGGFEESNVDKINRIFQNVRQGGLDIASIRSQAVNDAIKKKEAQIAEEQAGMKAEQHRQQFEPFRAPVPLAEGVQGPEEKPLSLYQMDKLSDINKTPATTNYRNMPIDQVLPNYTENDLREKFGAGISPKTPYGVAIKQAEFIERRKMNELRTQRAGTLFPVAGLTEEAQVKAQRAGFGKFITESQARILQAGTLPRPASAEEIKDVANFDTMSRQFDKTLNLFNRVGQDAVGVENYYINQVGQFSPIDGLKTDPEIVEFYQQLNDINNQIIYLRSGKQINEQEYERLKATFPMPNLNPEAFERRLKTFMQTFNDIKQTRTSAIEGSGKRLQTPKLNQGLNQSSQDILNEFGIK